VRLRLPRSSMKATVIVALVYGSLLAIAGLASVGASLPSNIVWGRTQLLGMRAELNMIAGQNFAFFTRSPESDQVGAYRVNPDETVGDSLLVTPQNKAGNLLGLSRTQRAQGPEIALLVNAIPNSAWLDCGELDRKACLDGVRRQSTVFLRDTSRVPTLCGRVALTVEATTSWAYRHLTGTRYTIQRIAGASIECTNRR
jgi:antimicrobial peptide system SdpA family protein